MSLIKKFVNYLFKIFNFKLIKINDQFSNSYRLVMAFKEKNIDFVFDVGANEGQFVKDLRYYGFKKKVLSFEPILSAHEKLKKFMSDNKWDVYEPIALGKDNVSNTINVTKNLFHQVY